MNPLEFSQYVYIAALMVGTVAAFCGGARFIALVMWMNLLFTIQFSHAPQVLAVLDLLSAVAIVLVVRDKAALTVAFLFGIMVFVYKLVEPFGFYIPYSIVEILAYGQVLAMGSTGFGNGIRIIRRGLRNLRAPSVHSQKTPLDAQANDFVAVGPDPGPRVNG